MADIIQADERWAMRAGCHGFCKVLLSLAIFAQPLEKVKRAKVAL